MEISQDFVLAAFGVALVAVLARDWLGRGKAANPDRQAHSSAAQQGRTDGERLGGGDGGSAGGGDGCGPGDAC